MDTDGDGKLYILGLASDVSLTVTEYKAPDGYNKLTETKTLTPQVLETTLYEASGTRKYDADGNLLEETATSGKSTTVERNLDELDENAPRRNDPIRMRRILGNTFSADVVVE